MLHKVVVIQNYEGLKARFASHFVQLASEFESQIFIERDNKKVNAKSIIGVLYLAAEQGDELHITATGPDEAKAIEALADYLENI